MSKITKYFSEKLDIFAAVAGCLMGAVVFYVGQLTHRQDTSEMGIAILVGCLIYVVLRKKVTEPTAPTFAAGSSLSMIFHIIYIVTLAGSFLLLHISLYNPPLYYLLMSLCTASVGAEIFLSREKTWGWILIKIILISLSLRFALYYEYPGLFGTDTWEHLAFIKYWIESGHISLYNPLTDVDTGYISMNVMHQWVIITNIVTSLDLKNSLYLSIGTFNIVSIVFIFLIVKRLLNAKAGLLMALFASINQFYILSGVFLIPNTFGLSLFTIIVYLLVKRNPSSFNSAFIVIISITLVFTHSVSAFIMAVALLVFVVANEIYMRIVKGKLEETSISYNLAILFIVMMISHWMYMFYNYERTMFVTFLGPFIKALQTDIQFTGLQFATADSSLNRIGFLLMMFFIMLGALYWLSDKSRNNLKVIIIVGAFILSSVTFIGPVMNLKNLVPQRWISFIFVLGAGLITQGLLVLPSLVKKQGMKTLLIAVIIFGYAFFNINNASVNLDSPFVTSPARYPYKQSEMNAADTILQSYKSEIIADRVFLNEYVINNYGPSRLGGYIHLLPWAKDKNWPEDLIYMMNKKFLPEYRGDNIILVRGYLYSHPEIMPQSGVEFLSVFDSREYDLVYNDGGAKAYLPRYSIE